MNVPAYVVVVILLVFGFLVGSTTYFYNKSRTVAATTGQKSTAFNGEIISSNKDNAPSVVDQQTKPADPKGRLSYPANVYVVQPKETLFAIGAKFGISWQLITQANGIINENAVQANYPLVIPKLNDSTDYYRVNFIINEDKATQLNQELRQQSSSDLFNPVNVAKSDAVPYFGLKADDNFELAEQDLSQGTAVVQVKKGDVNTVIGLTQPKIKGEKGFWAVVYIEEQN